MPVTINPNREHVWVAYYHDWSGMAAFADELDCLRYAVSNHMEAAAIPVGVDFRDAVKRTEEG